MVIAQAPVLQLVVACARAQVAPHAPQFVALFSWVSQPFPGFPSQSPQPISQVGWQPVWVHWVEPCALLQTSPHLRQFSTLPSWVSQPSAVLVLQFA
jgi:hypothetical protein